VGRPRRAGHPCNGCRASRGSVAARPNRSLGKLLEGSRRGMRPARWLGSGAARWRGPRVQRRGRGGVASEAESGARRKRTTLTCGAVGSARVERGRSAAGLGRGKRPAQEGGGERKRWRTRAFGPGKREDGEAVRAGG
jgi:hypothetical protein